ncbi:MAG: DUF1802 family protein [Chthoniobacteraceae bacterium]
MSIGFKEWTLICDALGSGAQSIIIRKGGIHEGRDGFRFQHEAFFLFPTLFHEQVAKLKLPEETPLPSREDGQIVVRQFCRIEWTQLVTDRAVVEKLAPFHLWRDEEIEKRFIYDEPAGVNVAVLRTYSLAQPWTFPDSPRYGGCRSWVNLPENAPTEMPPAISDEAHAERVAALKAIIGHGNL